MKTDMFSISSFGFLPQPGALSRGPGIINALINAGYDVTVHGPGADTASGGPGNDAIYGGAGRDTLTGATGDDLLVGGRDGDSYAFTAFSGSLGFGHDTIIDHGQAGAWDNQDSIVLNGVYGGTGVNFIWTGGGADTLIFQSNDALLFGSQGGGPEVDIVDDFDITADRLDFRALGIGLDDLTILPDAQGDATIAWESGNGEIADIFIELRGVSTSDATADIFVFI